MADNAQELIRRRKKERAMLRQKTLLEAEMNGGMISDRFKEEEMSRDADESAVTGQGVFGRKYQSEIQERSPSPRIKSQYELDIESKMEKINELNRVKVVKNDLLKINYKLSDFDEEAEEVRKALEEKRIKEQKKREAQEMARLIKVSFKNEWRAKLQFHWTSF